MSLTQKQSSNSEQLIEQISKEYLSMRNHIHSQLKTLVNGFKQLSEQEGNNTENQRIRIDRLNLNELCTECYARQYAKQKKQKNKNDKEETTYCFCGQPESGKMVACDNSQVYFLNSVLY